MVRRAIAKLRRALHGTRAEQLLFGAATLTLDQRMVLSRHALQNGSLQADWAHIRGDFATAHRVMRHQVERS